LPSLQGVFAEFAIQHELITTSLDHRRSSVQLVQKQNALSILREKVRCCPLRPAILPDEGQPTQIHRVEQQGAYVAQGDPQLGGKLMQHRALSRSWRSPNEHWLLFQNYECP